MESCIWLSFASDVTGHAKSVKKRKSNGVFKTWEKIKFDGLFNWWKKTKQNKTKNYMKCNGGPTFCIYKAI